MPVKFFLPAFALLGLTALCLFAPGCLRDRCNTTRTFLRYDPIYKTTAECRVGLQVQGPRALATPGKIYYFDHYLLINEVREGIHVIDNSDPANPVPLAFWSIPGNVDMAVRGDYLYADQYIDLLTIDLQDLQNPQVVCRRENAFTLFGFDLRRGWLVGYDETEVTEDVACNDERWNNNGWFMAENGGIIVSDVAFASSGGSSLPAGIGGSYARFGLYDQYLYTVDNTSLKSWTLSSPECPVRTDSILIGWNIETIFPWKDRLFVGSQQGVFIFNNSNPQHPVLESTFWHATGCDPVVCDEENAYVTLHDGTTCNGTLNQLEVIDIGGLPATSLTATYPMQRPFGLAVRGDYLYLCDDGLKVFDKTDPAALQQVAHLKTLQTYDVIALSQDLLLVIGADGFYQFDITDPAAPRLISHLKVNG